MKAQALAILATMAPDKGAALAEHQKTKQAALEAEQAALEEAEAIATTAALASVQWDRLHGDTLRKYDLALADWWQGWEVAKRKGDARDTMQPRPLRPDYFAHKGLAVNDTYAPLASASAMRSGPAWADNAPRWTVGEGAEWEGTDGSTRARAVISETKGARDDRQGATACTLAYERRSYEGGEGPHRAPSLAQQQARQVEEWQAELARVNQERLLVRAAQVWTPEHAEEGQILRALGMLD